jgi:hypothetical protein
MRYSYGLVGTERAGAAPLLASIGIGQGNLNVPFLFSNLFNLLSLSCLFIFFLLGEATSFSCYCVTLFFSKRGINWRPGKPSVTFLRCGLVCQASNKGHGNILVDDKPMQIKRESGLSILFFKRH